MRRRGLISPRAAAKQSACSVARVVVRGQVCVCCRVSRSRPATFQLPSFAIRDPSCFVPRVPRPSQWMQGPSSPRVTRRRVSFAPRGAEGRVVCFLVLFSVFRSD